MEPHQLLSQLISEGGAIVCTGDCSVIEIADAQATGRMAVNGDGIGFIRRTKEWLALQKAREEAPVCACEFKFSLSQERCLRLAELEGDSNP